MAKKSDWQAMEDGMKKIRDAQLQRQLEAAQRRVAALPCSACDAGNTCLTHY